MGRWRVKTQQINALRPNFVRNYYPKRTQTGWC
jgi:hypothetical protein